MMVRKIKYFFPVFIVATTIGFVFAYDNITTHPQLSRAAVNAYQNYSGKTLTQQQASWIVQGSVDEDAAPRYLNHYYNPVTNSGLNDWDEFLRMDVDGVSAKEWAQNQSGYTSHTGDYSEPAILENYRIGNKERAYQGVGHILHLMQDMSVPAHTRNDSHAGGDPYENWAKQNGSAELSKAGFISVQNLDDAFNGLAAYSNNNFFSKDTLVVTKEAERIGDYFYCRDKNNNRYKCFKRVATKSSIEYVIDDPLVHSDYWDLLSPKAVGYSAGVIDYFVKQFEKIDVERQKASLAANIVNGFMATFSRIQYTWGDVFMAANVPLSETAIAGIKVFNSFADSVYYPLSAQLAGLIPTNPQPQLQAATVVQPRTAPVPVPVIETPFAVEQAPALVSQLSQEGVIVPLVQPVINDSQIPATNTASSPVVPPADDAAPLPVPVYRGSGSVTGVSPDVLVAQNQPAPAAQAQTQNTETFATSTADVFMETKIATSTDSTATSTESVVATSTEPVVVAVDPAPVVPEIVYNDPVVINEIAWMGTKAQANDEWIELYNKTNHDIDLSGWALESKGKTFSVALSGAIVAHEYFLLERTASSTTDQAENMIFTGSLNNSGPEANLYLKNGATVVDSVDFSGQWPAGDNGKRYTMERVSAYAPSALSFNWKSYGDPDAIVYAKDAKGNDVYGTPGRKNSVTGYYTPTGDITENTTWHKEQSPYYVPPYMLQVQSGATLTIEPGVVVKFANGMPYGGGMDVRGSMRAEGTMAAPIVFTSFSDDAADGVDSNRDNTTTSPASADWVNVNVYNTATPSLFSHVLVRYGGQGISRSNGVFGIHGSNPQITDSFFDKNNAIAIYVEKGGHPMVARTTIKNTVVPASMNEGMSGFGVRIADADSTADIIGNVFEDNSVGISSESATDIPFVVKDNVFTHNQKNGEFNGYYYGILNLENANNQDSEHKGGFYIKIVIRKGQTKTLHVDAMPYIVENGIIVEEGGMLTIEPGTVIKSKNANNSGSFAAPVVVKGTLRAQGVATQPIVFTAFADDSDGYDSDGVIATPNPGAWENIQFVGAASFDSILEYANIRYGGRESYAVYKGAVRIQDASPRISHVAFDQNLAIAMFIEGLSQPTIEYSDIRNTQEAVITPSAPTSGIGISIGPESQPILTDNTYANNTEDVVYRE